VVCGSGKPAEGVRVRRRRNRGPFQPAHAPDTGVLKWYTIISKGPLVMVESRGLGKLADGRAYENRYAWAVEIRDGKVFAIREYMDSHYVAKLFGFT
jgi:ketosteroid isomerase-like protein